MIYFILLLLFSFLTRPAYAISDPTGVPNNKYGIHIADLNDIPDVPTLINSSGGDWGYVTLVSTDNDRDPGRWQQLFNEMRRMHIIPIIRLATHVDGDRWTKPDANQFDSIVSFFNSLNWPIQNRYVILYNEPNHANEWGGTLYPEEYADDVVTLSQKFKKASADFFILPAGLDESAESDSYSLDGFSYIRRMLTEKPDLFNYIDGWTSHSYPNPGFSGSPYAAGRGSLRTYQAELTYLQSLGLTKKLPVFITETGWEHGEGKDTAYNDLSSAQVGSDMQIAAQSVWTDPQIAAITPFVFNYQDAPFDHFSWKKLGQNDFYPQYEAYQSIAKIQGQPVQNEYYTLNKPILPETLVSNSTYTLTESLNNKGQGILNESAGYALLVSDPSQKFMVITDPMPVLEPEDKGEITIHVKTPAQPGIYPIRISITHNGRDVQIEKHNVLVVPPPSVRITAQLGWRRVSEATDATLLIYDNQTLVHKISGLALTNGTVTATALYNIVPGKIYRIVLLVPYYLPRQVITSLSSRETSILMKRFYPFDINKDGRLSIADLWALLRNPPKDMLHLFISP